jgi:hypothetical protein
VFWLSHHSAEEYSRTVTLGGVRICSRCLATYPVLVAMIAVQLALRAPLAWRADGLWTLGLLAPALGDWAYGRFRPQSGSNAQRMFTGALLGLALGRSLYIHFLRPLPVWLLAQVALVTLVAAPVILLTYRRRRPG